MDVKTLSTARDYLRVSQDRSGRGKSNTEQHDANKRVAGEHGWKLGKSYEDRAISASRYSKKAREGYDDLVADLQSGEFGADVLIIWESARGSRRVGEWVLLCDLLEEQGVLVHVTTHGRTYNPRNPRDRRSLLEDAVDSEYESGKQSDRLVRDAAAAAHEGKPPSRSAFGHPRRYWSTDDQGRRERYRVPDEQIEAEREAVRAAYDGLFAGRSLTGMARELNEKGLLTAHRGTWGPTSVRKMLRNPRNAGIRYYRGERLDVETTWEPIVSEETWQAAVHLLDDPRRRRTTGTARRWIGGGLYWCGQCDASDMVSNYHLGDRTYRCRATGHNTRRAERIDGFVLETMAARLRRGDVVALLADHDERDHAAELHTEASGLRSRLDSLGVDYAEGSLTAGQVRAATDRIETRLAEIDGELGRLSRADQLGYLLGADDAGQQFLDAAVDVQRSTIDALCTVTVLQNRGGRLSMADSVRITWRDGD